MNGKAGKHIQTSKKRSWPGPAPSPIASRQYSTLSCIISECLEAIEISIPQSNVSKDGLPLIPRGKGVSSEMRDVFTLEGSASRTRILYVVIIVWM